MNKTLVGVIAFVAGSAVGAGSVYYILGKKFDKRLEKELEAITIANGEEVISEREMTPEEVEIMLYEKQMDEERLNAQDFADDFKRAMNEYTGEEDDESGFEYEFEYPIEHDKPILIPESEFGDVTYQQVYYILYNDGVIADDMDRPVKDVDGMFGLENLRHFGDDYLYPNQNDAIYIRDDTCRYEYEIVKDNRSFDTEKYPNSMYRLEE